MYTRTCGAIFEWVFKNFCPPRNGINIICFQSKQHNQQYCHVFQQNQFEEVDIFEKRGQNSRTPELVMMADKSDNVVKLICSYYASLLKIEVE